MKDYIKVPEEVEGTCAGCAGHENREVCSNLRIQYKSECFKNRMIYKKESSTTIREVSAWPDAPAIFKLLAKVSSQKKHIEDVEKAVAENIEALKEFDIHL